MAYFIVKGYPVGGWDEGRPDQGLPGWSGPVDPGYGHPGGGNYPSGGPVRPGGPVDPGYGRPGWGGSVDPGYGHGGGFRPDNSLPTPPGGGHIDNSLPAPPVGIWPPLNLELPDNTLPEGGSIKALVLVWLYGQGWRWAALPVEPPVVDNTLPPTAQPK